MSIERVLVIAILIVGLLLLLEVAGAIDIFDGV
jgi:hypothetical protein